MICTQTHEMLEMKTTSKWESETEKRSMDTEKKNEMEGQGPK